MRVSVSELHTARTPESMSVPQRPSRVRPQPLMSLSSITTSLTSGDTRMASCCAPRSVRPRTITYEAFTLTLNCAELFASSTAPLAPW